MRGYAENLPLQRWLNEKVFPFEDKLDDEAAYHGTQLAIAEMLACGTVSFTDMYFFLDGMTRAILESGIKCNLSRGLTVFDDSSYEALPAYQDNLRLLGEWNGANQGRLRGDLCIHGEYTSTPKVVEAVAAQAGACGARMHIHLSETQEEHEACKQRHGMTPAAVYAGTRHIRRADHSGALRLAGGGRLRHPQEAWRYRCLLSGQQSQTRVRLCQCTQDARYGY